MTAIGVICEYNPFHLGHRRQLAEARHGSRADGIVCILSSWAVQRGELPVLTPSARAEMALRSGADLVLSLPVPWAAASAGHFAAGGVSILKRLGCISGLSFGSESGDGELLSAVASCLSQKETQADIAAAMKSGIGYAAARERVLRRFMGDAAAVLRNPNDTLGIEYMLAAGRQGAQWSFWPVFRVGNHDGTGEGYPSAGQIRSVLRAGQDVSAMLPKESAEILRREALAGRLLIDDGFFRQWCLGQLRTMSEEEYKALPDGGEGLWMRLQRFGRQESSVEAVLAGCRTKRYPDSRLRRMVFAAGIGMTASDGRGLPPYTQVLGMNDRGRELLAYVRDKTEIPILTKPAAGKALPEPSAGILELESRCADLRALCLPSEEARRGGSFWRQSPVYIHKKD